MPLSRNQQIGLGVAALAAAAYLYEKRKASAAAAATAANATSSVPVPSAAAGSAGGGYIGSGTASGSGAASTYTDPEGNVWTQISGGTVGGAGVWENTSTGQVQTGTPPFTANNAAANEIQGTGGGFFTPSPSGSTYGPISQTPVVDASGNSYSPIENPSQLANIQSSGETVYWQPSPGVFLPVPAGFQATGLPVYFISAGPGAVTGPQATAAVA